MSERTPLYGSKFSGWLGIQFYAEPNGSIVGDVILQPEQEGPPLYAHGGISASLLDEAMGTSAWWAGYKVVAANLNLNYRQPVPLGVEIHIRGHIQSIEGRKIYTAGSITLPDGTVAIESTGLFIHAPHIFEGMDFPLSELIKRGEEPDSK
ncbi:MAG: PaaI family thioesterase [Anaerolineaceae bacterium]|nr:PaaI family thioesterase [Anaerolineaceae bacterium]